MLLPGVLPAPRRVMRAARQRRRGGRADAVLGRIRGAPTRHRAHRRCDDRPPAHRAPGPDALQRDVLGRRQRGPAQAGARRDHAPRSPTTASRSGTTSRTARSSRTPSRVSTCASPAGASRTTRSASATARRRPDFGALCVQRQRWANGGLLMLPRRRRAPCARGRASGGGRCSRTVPASQLPRLDRLGERRALAAALLPVRPDAALALRAADRAPVLRRDLDRPADAAATSAPTSFACTGSTSCCCRSTRLGVVRIDRPGDRRPEDRVRAHAQGRKRTITPLAFVTLPFLIIAVVRCHARERHLTTRSYPHAAFSGINALLTRTPCSRSRHPQHGRRRRPRHPATGSTARPTTRGPQRCSGPAG